MDADNRGHLRSRYSALGGWDALADELGINVSYVYGYVEHGIIPRSREIQKVLGIVDKRLQFARERRNKLKVIYEKKGWKCMYEYNSALIKGETELKRASQ